MPTVLLVDDDATVLRFCSSVLAGVTGLDLLQAANGSQAIDVAARHTGPIELLLSDISMPGGLNGVELAEQLTRSRPAMKVLLMSGLATGDLTLHPAWQFLAKPFLPGDLVARVQDALATAAPCLGEAGFATPPKILLRQANGRK